MREARSSRGREMLRRWLRRVEHGRRMQAAADLEAWLASLAFVLETCSEAHRPLGAETDIGTTLDRVDRELMRFRNHSADIRPRLRRASPVLGEAVRRLTDDTFHLRNHTHAYLLRWQSWRRQTGYASSASIDSRREMEEALLRASETARSLRADLATFSPQIHELIDAWSVEG